MNSWLKIERVSKSDVELQVNNNSRNIQQRDYNYIYMLPSYYQNHVYRNKMSSLVKLVPMLKSEKDNKVYIYIFTYF